MNVRTEFQGVIRRFDDMPIGALADVERELCQLFPGLHFEWSKSGAETLIEADQRGIELPAIVRQVLQSRPSNRTGCFENDELSISLNLGAVDPPMRIWATAGGKQAATVVSKLQARDEWSIESPEQLTVAGTDIPPALSGAATLFWQNKEPKADNRAKVEPHPPRADGE